MQRLYVPLLRLLAPVAAVFFALVVSGLVLKLSGNDPLHAFDLMWDFGTTEQSIASIVDRSVPLYLSGVAFAIAFKMGLFNIGVEGQYTIAVLMAAFVGAAVNLPPVLHVTLILVVAMLSGMVWGAIPGVLKVTRGVSEVISTIMLNAIATFLVSYLLANHFLDRADETLNLQTKKIPESGWFPDLAKLGDNATINAIVLLALAVGIGYYVLIWRTRFGYDLRASGLNPLAAQASGVAPRAMIVKGMMLSGRGGRTGRHAHPARLLPQLRAGLRHRARVRRHHRGPARAQQPDRHRDRRPPAGLPRPQRPDPRPRGHRQGDRGDHGGGHRPVGGHRLRAGAAGHREATAADDR